MSRINRFSCNITNVPGTTGNIALGLPQLSYVKPPVSYDGTAFTMVFVMGSGDFEVRTGCIYSFSASTLTRGTLESSSVISGGVYQPISLDSTTVATSIISAGELDLFAAGGGLPINLQAIGGLTSAADTLPYFTGSGTAATTALTSAARTFLAATTVTAEQTALGLGQAALLNTSDISTLAVDAPFDDSAIYPTLSIGSNLQNVTNAYAGLAASLYALQPSASVAVTTGVDGNGNLSVTFTTTLAGNTTGALPSAGQIGEDLSVVVVSGSALPMTTGQILNVTSKILNTGTYDVTPILCVTGGGTTPTNLAVNSVSCGASLTSATMPSTKYDSGQWLGRGASLVAGDSVILGPTLRFTVASGTSTVYLVAQALFTGTSATMSAYGKLRIIRSF